MAGELADLDQKVKHADKGKWLLVGIGFVTLIVTYLMFKHIKSQPAGAAAGPAPAGGGGIDPTTGMPYAMGMPGGAQNGAAPTPDWSALSTNINGLIQQEGALTTQLTNALSPPPGSSPQSYDYSAFGPYANAIAADYQAALGRAPDFGGLQAWQNQVQLQVAQGQSVQQAESNIATAIGQSAEATQYTSTGTASAGSVNSSGFFTAKPATGSIAGKGPRQIQ